MKEDVRNRDCKFIPKRPPKNVVTLMDDKPMSAKARKRLRTRKAFEASIKRCFGGSDEKEDYMESWRKSMRRLSFSMEELS